MGFYALSMAAIASILNNRGRPATDLVIKFLEHFALITEALESQGLWDETDGFFYDRLRLPDGREVPIKVRSIVGMLPMLGVAVIDENVADRAETVNKRAAAMLRATHPAERGPDNRQILLGVVGVPRVLRLLSRLFDEQCSFPRAPAVQFHDANPFVLDVEACTPDLRARRVDAGMFGGNRTGEGRRSVPSWRRSTAARASA
jgi:hypothetical protein